MGHAPVGPEADVGQALAIAVDLVPERLEGAWQISMRLPPDVQGPEPVAHVSRSPVPGAAAFHALTAWLVASFQARSRVLSTTTTTRARSSVRQCGTATKRSKAATMLWSTIRARAEAKSRLLANRTERYSGVGSFTSA